MVADAQTTVLILFEARPGEEERLGQELSRLVERTRATMGGLVNYDLHRDEADGSRYMLYENWTNARGPKEHAEMPYVGSFWEAEEREQLLAKPMETSIWRMISEPWASDAYPTQPGAEAEGERLETGPGHERGA